MVSLINHLIFHSVASYNHSIDFKHMAPMPENNIPEVGDPSEERAGELCLGWKCHARNC